MNRSGMQGSKSKYPPIQRRGMEFKSNCNTKKIAFVPSDVHGLVEKTRVNEKRQLSTWHEVGQFDTMASKFLKRGYIYRNAEPTSALCANE